MKEFKQEHLLEETTNRYGQYLNTRLVDYDRSYTVESKPNAYGSRLVYQYVVMKDDTVYNLKSWSASTRGIIPNKGRKNQLQRDVKSYFDDDTINY
jgi:hypothetical protein